MTDNDIIKALECCLNSRNFEECNECGYVECMTDKGCLGELLTDGLDLINRQKAEIESLQNKLDFVETKCISMVSSVSKITRATRREAITEFAERLKNGCGRVKTEGKSMLVFTESAFDQIAKEMKGE